MAELTASVQLSILVVSHNTRRELLECLASVFSTVDLRCAEVIVIDNDSSDGSPDAVAAQFPDVRLTRVDRNLGFAGGNNLAARQARGELLLLLNPDTVVREGTIERVVSFARQHPHAIIGGRTFFADGKLNPTSCHGWPTLWSVTCQGLGLSSLWRRSRLFNPEGLGSWKRDTVREVPVVTGCFMLVPRAVWDRLGGFDEAFFMYGEETDLCMRAARAGFRRLLCPGAELVHHGGASEKVRAHKMLRLFRAKATLYQKHWGPIRAAYGVGMLKLWILTRLAGHAVFRGVNTPGQQAWLEVWRRRREFSQPPHGSLGGFSGPPAAASA